MNASQLLLERLLRDCGVKRCLPTQPPAIAQAEVTAKSKISVGRDGSPACDDFTDTLGRNADVFGKTVLGKPERLEKLFIKHLPR